MSGDPVIQMRDVGKAYDLLKAETNVFSRFVMSKAHALLTHETLWALRGIDLTVERGKMIGLLGPNGAGKSTLLKLIAGITPPTEGTVEVKGRVAAMLEVDLGFHDDLTGYENIYLHGAVLGLPRAEIDRQLGQIVAFAEIGEFMSMPVKHYSSGMRARLGFAIAIHSQPDIVLADEVLAVGDGNFQVKCLDAMGNFKRDGKTLVFVTHNIRFARAHCDQILWIDHGRIVDWGPSGDVATRYLEEASSRAMGNAIKQSDQRSAVKVKRVSLIGPGGEERSAYDFGEPLEAVVEGETLQPLEEPDLRASLVRSDHEIIAIESARERGECPAQMEGPFSWRIRWPEVFLNEGDYTLHLQMRARGLPALFEPIALRFHVHAPHFTNPHVIADIPCRFSIRPAE